MAMRCASTLFSLVAIIELACASLNETVAFSETSAQSRTEDSSRYIFVGNKNKQKCGGPGQAVAQLVCGCALRAGKNRGLGPSPDAR